MKFVSNLGVIWEMRNDLKYIRKNMTDVKLIDHFTFITERWKYKVTVGDKRYIIMCFFSKWA